jgi:uncharacterized repeat protein (TIGR01451 family)
VSGNHATGGDGDFTGGAPSGNGGQGLGGGIYVFGLTSPLMVNSFTLVHDNTATGGAGGEVSNIITPEGVSLLGGDAGGGGIYAVQTSVQVNLSYVYRNSAQGGSALIGSVNGGAASGGGIFIDTYNAANAATLTVTNSQVYLNSATTGFSSGVDSGPAALGGGVYAHNVPVNVMSSFVYSNFAVGGPGGVALGYTGTGGAGAAAEGGGLYANGGTAAFTNSSITYNSVGGGQGGTATAGTAGTGGQALGAGVYAFGVSRVNVTNSTIGWNNGYGGVGGPNSLNGGKGGDADGGGMYYAANGSFTMTGSTVADNTLYGGSGSFGSSQSLGAGGGTLGGGLVLVSPGPATITSSTVANNTINTPVNSSGTPAFLGGGIFNAAHLQLYSDTIAGNSIAGQYPTQQFGGGVYNFSGLGGTVTIANTIVAQNSAANAPDFAGPVASSNHDLIGDGTGSSGFSAAHGDQVGNLTVTGTINPMLTPLQNNGGPTWTMALLPGSPAIDKGSNAAAKAAVDQRGLQRIVNKTIDIGATEYQADLRVTLSATPNPVVAGNTITYTITVTNLGPDTAGNVTLTDLLPPGTTFVSFNGPAGWTLTNPSGSNPATATIATLAPGTSATFTLVVQVNPGTASGTIITDTATVTPLTWDPKVDNNAAQVKTTVA